MKMSERAPLANNNEYLEHHPNAIEDKYKAEIMAYASAEWETKAAELRAEAIGSIATRQAGEPAKSVDAMVEEIKTMQHHADTAALRAAKKYDALQATKRQE